MSVIQTGAVSMSPAPAAAVAEGATGGIDQLFAQLLQQVQAQLQGQMAGGGKLPLDGELLPPEIPVADVRAEIEAQLRGADVLSSELDPEALDRLIDRTLAELERRADRGDTEDGVPFVVARPETAEGDALPGAEVAALSDAALQSDPDARSSSVESAPKPQPGGAEVATVAALGDEERADTSATGRSRELADEVAASTVSRDARAADRAAVASPEPSSVDSRSAAATGVGYGAERGDSVAASRLVDSGDPAPAASVPLDSDGPDESASPRLADQPVTKATTEAATPVVAPVAAVVSAGARADGGAEPRRSSRERDSGAVRSEAAAELKAELKPELKPELKQELRAQPREVASSAANASGEPYGRSNEEGAVRPELIVRRSGGDMMAAPAGESTNRTDNSLSSAFSALLGAIPSRAEAPPVTPPSLAQLQSLYQAAPGNPPTWALPQRFGSQEWSPAASQRITWMANQGIGSAELRLDPPELGSLHVRLTLNQDQASLSFTSPHAQVREVLEQQMPRLREMLAEHGIDLQRGDVSDQRAGQDAQRRGEEGRTGAFGDASATADDSQELLPAGAPQRLLSLVDAYA
ncbi:flagellar hook-length control protein FliK [Motiliproteus sediminis]|uniref:flagellar hook-length control protein FliK n=1 Tax=Motiliproteus sediminis TaxID=1468178 RepID=UPI001AEF4D55|nr:flagellar hook-length control protein FliK [Motiliproteus sediminis]